MFTAEKLDIYETDTHMYLVGYDSNQTTFRVLKVDRILSRPNSLADILIEDPTVYSKSGVQDMLKTLHEGNKNEGGVNKITSAHGLVGFVHFLDCFYMTLITKKQKIGCIRDNFVYTIKETEMLPIKPKEEKADELRYLTLFKFVDMTKDFYFSYTYDLTSTFQHNYVVSESTNLSVDTRPMAQETFEWNHYQTESLRNITKVNKSHWFWVLPIIQGSYCQRKFSIYGRELDMILIARRSRHYAGTRYLKRGISVHGKVANDCETEQILQLDTGLNASYSSFVQVRGSIPVYWSQETSVTMPKPPINISRFDPAYNATRDHFNDLMVRYKSPIIALDLVKQQEKYKRETLVGMEYRQAVDEINASLPWSKKIRYCALDYDALKRKEKLDKKNKNRAKAVTTLPSDSGRVSPSNPMRESLSKMPTVNTSAEIDDVIEELENARDEEDGDQPIRQKRVRSALSKGFLWQTGVMRTNCIDCIDRTNAAQIYMGMKALDVMIQSLEFDSSTTNTIYSNTILVRGLIEMYTNMGNQISIQYGGSEAHLKFAGVGAEGGKSGIGEGLTSVKRYYNNSFLDIAKQHAMNVFLGMYVPREEGAALQESEGGDYHLHNRSLRPRKPYINVFLFNEMVREVRRMMQVKDHIIGGPSEWDDHLRTICGVVYDSAVITANRQTLQTNKPPSISNSSAADILRASDISEGSNKNGSNNDSNANGQKEEQNKVSGDTPSPAAEQKQKRKRLSSTTDIDANENYPEHAIDLLKILHRYSIDPRKAHNTNRNVGKYAGRYAEVSGTKSKKGKEIERSSTRLFTSSIANRNSVLLLHGNKTKLESIAVKVRHNPNEGDDMKVLIERQDDALVEPQHEKFITLGEEEDFSSHSFSESPAVRMLTRDLDIDIDNKGFILSLYALKSIIRGQKRKNISRIMKRRIASALEMWWNGALYEHISRTAHLTLPLANEFTAKAKNKLRRHLNSLANNEDMNSSPDVSSAKKKSSSPFGTEKVFSYFERIHKSTKLTSFDSLLNMSFLTPSLFSSVDSEEGKKPYNIFDTGRESTARFRSPSFRSAIQSTDIMNSFANRGTVSTDAQTLTPNLDDDNDDDTQIGIKGFFGNLKRKASNFVDEMKMTSTKSTGQSGVTADSLKVITESRTGHLRSASQAYNDSMYCGSAYRGSAEGLGFHEPTDSYENQVPGIKEDAEAKANGVSKSPNLYFRRVEPMKPPSFGQSMGPRVSKRSMKDYNLYCRIAQNPELIANNDKISSSVLWEGRNDADEAARQEYTALLREVTLAGDDVAGMHTLAADSYVSFTVQRGMYNGMSQQQSAVDAEYFLNTSIARVENQLNNLGAQEVSLDTEKVKDAFNTSNSTSPAKIYHNWVHTHGQNAGLLSKSTRFLDSEVSPKDAQIRAEAAIAADDICGDRNLFYNDELNKVIYPVNPALYIGEKHRPRNTTEISVKRTDKTPTRRCSLEEAYDSFGTPQDPNTEENTDSPPRGGGENSSPETNQTNLTSDEVTVVSEAKTDDDISITQRNKAKSTLRMNNAMQALTRSVKVAKASKGLQSELYMRAKRQVSQYGSYHRHMSYDRVSSRLSFLMNESCLEMYLGVFCTGGSCGYDISLPDQNEMQPMKTNYKTSSHHTEKNSTIVSERLQVKSFHMATMFSEIAFTAVNPSPYDMATGRTRWRGLTFLRAALDIAPFLRKVSSCKMATRREITNMNTPQQSNDRLIVLDVSEQQNRSRLHSHESMGLETLTENSSSSDDTGAYEIESDDEFEPGKFVDDSSGMNAGTNYKDFTPIGDDLYARKEDASVIFNECSVRSHIRCITNKLRYEHFGADDHPRGHII
eukprot:GSChrysophyteH1.ASY1.ANO1.3092.1 assembled CDS